MYKITCGANESQLQYKYALPFRYKHIHWFTVPQKVTTNDSYLPSASLISNSAK